jgi:hypothetical protein
MPNWCNNIITFRNGNKKEVDKLEKYLKKLDKEDDTSNIGEGLFTYFRPRPKDEDEQWYEWNCSNWGTKWEASLYEWRRDSEHEITAIFDTAWGPPIALCEHLANETEWYPVGEYHEEGMGLIGTIEGDYNEHYEYTDLDSLENIPEELLENWGVRDRMEEMEEDEEFDEEGVELELDEEFDAKLQELKEEFDAIMMPTEKTLLFADDESKDWLKTLLRERSVTVTFEKKDGSERKMCCTLSEEEIPPSKAPKGTGKKENSDSLAVFDLEKEEWRSFRWDSVKKIEFGVEESQK